MTYYTKIIGTQVDRVILADNAFMNNFKDTTPGTWIQTNTREASPGDLFDQRTKRFYKPQPYVSWLLDENLVWQPPVAMPTDGLYKWNEATQTWDTVTFG